MENTLNPPSEENELELLKINLSRGRGEIALPTEVPEKIPKQ